MVEAILAALAATANSVGAIFSTSGRRYRYERMPKWFDPRSFDKRDNTPEIALIVVGIILVALVIGIVITANKKK
jgi:hypothetical protein